MRTRCASPNGHCTGHEGTTLVEAAAVRPQELILRPLGYEPATWSPAIATISSPMRLSSSSPATQKGSGHTSERLGIERSQATLDELCLTPAE